MQYFFCVFGICIKFPLFWKKVSLIGQVFLKLLTPKYLLISMHTRACFWKPFDSERVNESQKLLKSTENYFYPTFSSFWAKLSEKKLFLIRYEILGLFDNTLPANCDYSSINWENLPLPIQVKISKKSETICGIFFAFLESTFNVQRSETKMSLIGQVFPKLLTPRDVLI